MQKETGTINDGNKTTAAFRDNVMKGTNVLIFQEHTHLTHKTDKGGENWSIAVFYNSDANATIKSSNNKHVGLTAYLSHFLTIGVCNIYTNTESGGFAL